MIDRELQALAGFVDLGAEHDLAPAVRARLRGRPSPRPGLVVGVAAALLAVAVAFAVSPARSSLLRFLHLQGASIHFVERLPAVHAPHPLDLGIAVTAAEAEQKVGFRPLTSPLLGRPDAVTWDGEMVWYRFGRTRVLVSQFRGSQIGRYIDKLA